jgi:glycerol-3-phosphate dehydrogenase
VLNERLQQPSADNVKLIKGSHIVLPRQYEGDHALILQNDDRRVVFMIPYQDELTLIGTTDIALDDDSAEPAASAEEIAYLCNAVNRYLARAISPQDVVWSYSGVRPLYDDGTANPSTITRDYTLRLDALSGTAPVLSVFGGKITTYRKLAEHALEKLRPWFRKMRPAWTADTPLPGGDIAGGIEKYTEHDLPLNYPWLPATLSRSLAHRHGALTHSILKGAQSLTDLGKCFGAELFAREVDYFIEQEWARTAADILYRRTKKGLQLTAEQCEVLGDYVAARVATSGMHVR